jgi:hypothetical protein
MPGAELRVTPAARRLTSSDRFYGVAQPTRVCEGHSTLARQAFPARNCTPSTEISGVTYNDSFQDRINNAAQAREKALAKLKAKPPLDEKVVAERVERQAQREAREAEKAAAKRAAREAEVAAREAEAAAKAAVPAPPTEEERKAARDARYAKRKARK